MQNRPVHDLGFTVGLGMSNRGQSMLNMVLGTKVLKLLIVELSTIIDDDGSWDAKSEDYMDSDKGFHLIFCDES